MSQKRIGGVAVLSVSFIAGTLLAAFICVPTAWDPLPEPFFGLDGPVLIPAAKTEAFVDAIEVFPGIAVNANPLLTLTEGPRSAAATPSSLYQEMPPKDQTPRNRGVGDLSHMAAVLAAQPPERLALQQTDGFQSVRIASQTLPIPQPTNAPTPAVEHPASVPQPVPSTQAPNSLRDLVVRRQAIVPSPLVLNAPAADESTPASLPVPAASSAMQSLGAAPVPHESGEDLDSLNWSDAPTIALPKSEAISRLKLFSGLLGEIRSGDGQDEGMPKSIPGDHATGPLGGRILERLRTKDRLLARAQPSAPAPATIPSIRVWPQPTTLIGQLEKLSSTTRSNPLHAAADEWAKQTRDKLDRVLATQGPPDAASDMALVSLDESVHSGMTLADSTSDVSIASSTRRTALALSRRVAVWRTASALFASPPDSAAASHLPTSLAGGVIESEVAMMLDALERFEQTLAPAEAVSVKASLAAVSASPLTGAKSIAKSVGDHYLAPNVRIAVHENFCKQLLPEATIQTGPMSEVVLGRKVRGTRTVEQTTAVRLTPDSDEICFELEVHGDIASRTITESGPVAVTASGASAFTVLKPFKLSSQGLLFGDAVGVASNRSHLDTIQTSFDSVPVMRSVVRSIVKSQHEGSLPELNREVTDKIISRACREVDEQAEPKFIEFSERVRTKLWQPLTQLGLEPTAVAMETTATVATVRLRLAADNQLAAHTPRPRAPSDSQCSVQMHESSLNNAFERLDLAGRRLSLEELVRVVFKRLGIEQPIPPDLPEGVAVTFTKSRPLRIECRDGLMHVHVSIESLESGRRNWYDIVAHVAYKPSSSGPQEFLEREGPVQISGPGHQGRMEIALRTIFGKIFPKDRAIPLLPEKIVAHPRIAEMRALQAVCTDGWLAIAIGKREPSPTATAAEPATPERKTRVR